MMNNKKALILTFFKSSTGAYLLSFADTSDTIIAVPFILFFSKHIGKQDKNRKNLQPTS